jgi:hypothetical protein
MIPKAETRQNSVHSILGIPNTTLNPVSQATPLQNSRTSTNISVSLTTLEVGQREGVQ